MNVLTKFMILKKVHKLGGTLPGKVPRDSMVRESGNRKLKPQIVYDIEKVPQAWCHGTVPGKVPYNHVLPLQCPKNKLRKKTFVPMELQI